MAKTNYITTYCNNCNAKITKKRKNKNKNYYCDVDCFREFQKSGKYKIPKRKRGKNVICSVCNKEYYQVAYKAKEVKNNFCSRECYLKDHAINNKERPCEYCGIMFTADTSARKYCSKKCDLLSYRDKPSNICKCKQCYREFCRIAKDITGRIQYKCTTFCSKDCRIEYLQTNEDRKRALSVAFSGSKHPQWRGGRSYADGHRGERWKQIREICFQINNNKCTICGMTRDDHNKTYGFDMHIDHIKAWHRFSKDEKHLANRQDNLRPLCISCHTKHGDKSDKAEMIKRRKEYGTESCI